MTQWVADDFSTPADVEGAARGRRAAVAGRSRSPVENAYTRAQAASRQRIATRTQCPDCGAHVWVGLDADVLAMQATVNAWPATPTEELLAHVAGRGACTVVPVKAGVELSRRDAWQLRGSPAGTQGRPSHLDHRCTDVARDVPEPTTSWETNDDAPPY